MLDLEDQINFTEQFVTHDQQYANVTVNNICEAIVMLVKPAFIYRHYTPVSYTHLVTLFN